MTAFRVSGESVGQASMITANSPSTAPDSAARMYGGMLKYVTESAVTVSEFESCRGYSLSSKASRKRKSLSHWLCCISPFVPVCHPEREMAQHDAQMAPVPMALAHTAAGDSWMLSLRNPLCQISKSTPDPGSTRSASTTPERVQTLAAYKEHQTRSCSPQAYQRDSDAA